MRYFTDNLHKRDQGELGRLTVGKPINFLRIAPLCCEYSTQDAVARRKPEANVKRRVVTEEGRYGFVGKLTPSTDSGGRRFDVRSTDRILTSWGECNAN
jgi:hypothetical protein